MVIKEYCHTQVYTKAHITGKLSPATFPNKILQQTDPIAHKMHIQAANIPVPY